MDAGAEAPMPLGCKVLRVICRPWECRRNTVAALTGRAMG